MREQDANYSFILAWAPEIVFQKKKTINKRCHNKLSRHWITVSRNMLACWSCSYLSHCYYHHSQWGTGIYKNGKLYHRECDFCRFCSLCNYYICLLITTALLKRPGEHKLHPLMQIMCSVEPKIDLVLSRHCDLGISSFLYRCHLAYLPCLLPFEVCVITAPWRVDVSAALRTFLSAALSILDCSAPPSPPRPITPCQDVWQRRSRG